MKDKDINVSGDHPEADLRHIVRGIARRGLKPIPPKNITLDVPMSAAFKKVIASPTDSGDPAVY